MFEVKGGIVSNGDKSVAFKFHILKYIIINEDRIIILLDIPNVSPVINNIYCLNGNLECVWRVYPLERKYRTIRAFPYEDILLDNGELFAFDVIGRRYEINIETGDVLRYKLFK